MSERMGIQLGPEFEAFMTPEEKQKQTAALPRDYIPPPEPSPVQPQRQVPGPPPKARPAVRRMTDEELKRYADNLLKQMQAEHNAAMKNAPAVQQQPQAQAPKANPYQKAGVSSFPTQNVNQSNVDKYWMQWDEAPAGSIDLTTTAPAPESDGVKATGKGMGGSKLGESAIRDLKRETAYQGLGTGGGGSVNYAHPSQPKLQGGQRALETKPPRKGGGGMDI